MVRLEPMSEEDFQKSLARDIPRYAEELVRRGLATEDHALEASRTDFTQFLPNGRETPHHHLSNAVDDAVGARVGEAWYTVQERGGKTQFWIDWVWIEPKHRRQGYATQTLRSLEEEARRAGADRTGLSVWTDNPGAMALYSKLGYTTVHMRMSKSLSPVP